MTDNEAQPSPSPLTRRKFIKHAASAAAVAATANVFKTPVYGQNQAPSPGRVIGANDRIAVAVIGVGFGIGQNHLKGFVDNSGENNIVVAGACDLFSKRRDWAKTTAKLTDADVFDHHEKLLERKDIDAVLIAAHDPWHAQISIHALEAGKHVYCEKPLARYLGEGFKVAETVKRTGRTFQLGSQGCTAEGWHKCAELVRAGKIGEVIWSQGSYTRNSLAGEWNYPIEPESTAANIDWEQWLGPVKDRVPFNADHFHRWRKYFPYCAGVLGDLAPHRLLPLMLGSGDPQFPVRVTCIGTSIVHPDKNMPGALPRETPEHSQLLAEFPNGSMISLILSTVNAKGPGFEIHGHKATLFIGESGDRYELVPEKEFSDDIDPDSKSGLAYEDIRAHEKNWFECIRNGKTPNANIDLALRAQAVISLAEMSNRMNMACRFDEKTRKVTGADGKEIDPITYGALPRS